MWQRDEILDVVPWAVAGVAVVAGSYLGYRYLYPVGAVEFQGRRYRFTSEDKLWMARMVTGESGTSNMTAGAAVLWSVATRWVTNPRFQQMSFTQLMRNFSTPVMFNCRSGSASYCQRTSAIPWSNIDPRVRNLVEQFIRGRVPNPIPGYNNFAASWAIGSRSMASSELPPQDVGGNMFIRDPGSLPGRVGIV